MSNAASSDDHRLLKPACMAVVCASLAVFATRSVGERLWLDELLTMALIQAHSLPKLWAGIALGIDANPPIYLTLAWLLAKAFPASASVAIGFKLVNIAVTVAAVLALYRISLRMVSPMAAWAGSFVFVAVNSNVVFVALELRTYALYFLFGALAVLFQQRLIEQGRIHNVIALAAIDVALTLSHTFGVAYVVTIALAGGLSVWRNGWRRLKLTTLAAAPALLAFVCWMPVLIQQSAVGQPYLWFGPPDVPTLLQGLFSTPIAMWIAILELYGLVGVALWLVAKRRISFTSMLRSDEWQPRRYAVLIVLGLSGFLLTIWIISVIWFPMFVPRYFTPQLIAGFALHVAFADLLIWLVRERFAAGSRVIALIMTIGPVAMFSTVMLANDPVRQPTPCADSNGLAFERDFVRGELPIVVESPHIFMPRAAYADHGDAYRFPLDWEVVLNYRDRTRGNATDFHIFENLKNWAGMSSILSTDDIVRTMPHFLAIEHSSRAWFHNLRQTRDVTANKLAETSSPDGGTCTLWNVMSVTPRR